MMSHLMITKLVFIAATLAFRKAHISQKKLSKENGNRWWLYFVLALDWIEVDQNGKPTNLHPLDDELMFGEHVRVWRDFAERRRKISQIFIHEKYESTNYSYDIALVKLNKPLDFCGDDIHLEPICLNLDEKVDLDKCVLTGFGHLGTEAKGKLPNTLQQLWMKQFDHEQCKKALEQHYIDNPDLVGREQVTDLQICMRASNSTNVNNTTFGGGCPGDSGSPLQCMLNDKWYQVGVTWTVTDCDYGPTVFQHVPKYFDWIKNISGYILPEHCSQSGDTNSPSELQVGEGSTKVSFGQDAERGKWKSQVLIRLGKRKICGGSIISSEWVLTAAHCVYGIKVDQNSKPLDRKAATLVFGTNNLYDLDECERVRQISQIRIHEKFESRNYSFDIAVLKMSEPLNFCDDKHILPICLNYVQKYDRNNCVLTGFGLLGTNGVSPAKLQQLSMRQLDRDECAKEWEQVDNQEITEYQICMKANNSTNADNPSDGGSCAGDSGGPLHCKVDDKWFQVGVVWSSIDCERGPTAFQDVSMYFDWIYRETRYDYPAYCA